MVAFHIAGYYAPRLTTRCKFLELFFKFFNLNGCGTTVVLMDYCSVIMWPTPFQNSFKGKTDMKILSKLFY